MIGTLGIETEAADDGIVRGRIPVSDRILQPYGLVHGGALLTLAESLASHGTWVGVKDEGKLAMGQEINASLMRPITERPRERHSPRARRRGRTAWVWEVEITDDDGPPVRAGPRDDRRARRALESEGPSRNRFVIGSRRSRPNAFGVILMPGRRLAALVLGGVDHPDHAVHDVLRHAAADQLVAALVLLDVGLEDRVEQVVGRQAVGVALVGAQLGRRRRAR